MTAATCEIEVKATADKWDICREVYPADLVNP